MSLFNWLRRGRKPLHPSEFNLNHFNWVRWGPELATDDQGWGKALLYENEVKYAVTHHPLFEEKGPTIVGDEQFCFIADVAATFRNICEKLKELGEAAPGSPIVPLQIRFSEEIAGALFGHFQFQALQRISAGMGWRLCIVPYGDHEAEVVCHCEFERRTVCY